MNHLQSEWVMRTTKKKKQQAPVTQGIDTIIPTSQATPLTTTAPSSAKPGGSRQPRGKGTVVNWKEVVFCEKNGALTVVFFACERQIPTSESDLGFIEISYKYQLAQQTNF